MLTLVLFFLLIPYVGRMIGLAVRAAWGISRVVLSIVFFPLMLVLLAFAGLVRFAFFALIIMGILSLVCPSGQSYTA